MLYRKCPECNNKTLKIPLLSADYICLECVSVFNVSKNFKFLSFISGFIVFSIAFGLLSNGYLSFFEYGLLTYIVLPLILSVGVKITNMYWAPLTLGGVKGKVRENS